MNRYSTVNPDTGLHPRPSDPEHLAPLFPPNTIDLSYTSTCYPSRRGETLSQLQDRADMFIEAWTSRVEEMGVKCVVIFGHAASVIALGRAVRSLLLST
jgi:transcription factor C subunit 7